MIIEFCGIPGSGKTAMCDYLIHNLRKEGYHIVLANEFREKFKGFSKIRKVFFLLSAAFKNLFFLVGIPWIDLVRLNKKDREVIVKTLFTNIIERENCTCPVKGALFLDEGLVHRAYSVFVHLNSTAAIDHVDRYLKSVKLPTVLIYLKTSIPVAYERILLRGFPKRMEDLIESDSKVMLNKGDSFLNNYTDKLKTKRGLKVYVLDSNELAKAKEEALSIVRGLLGSIGHINL